MAATAAQIAQVRRQVAEPTTATYSDTLISDAILRYPVPDSFGVYPVDQDGNANTDWVATFDLASASAEIWQEKAAALASGYDFSADGGTYSRSQAMANAQKMASYYASRRAAKGIRLKAEMGPYDDMTVFNLVEELDD